MKYLPPRRCILIDVLRSHKVNARFDSIGGQGEFTYCITEVTKKPLNTSGTIEASAIDYAVQLLRVDKERLVSPSSPSHSGSESSIEEECLYLFCAPN